MTGVLHTARIDTIEVIVSINDILFMYFDEMCIGLVRKSTIN